MCGICGFAGNGSIDDLRRMNTMLLHRGPDAEGIWSDPSKGIFLGHRRLSVLDIKDGVQPMWTTDGMLGISFNGEIYNARELRHELEQSGHIFTSDHSDTEVLLHGYRAWGSELPRHLNGMWAFAIFDKVNNMFFLSRDRFGKKPLFYTEQSGTFMFASELTALQTHSSFTCKISRNALKKYFAYNYVPAPHTLYTSVYKLPPGYNLLYTLAERTTTVQQYWEFALDPFTAIPANAETVWAEELRSLIDKAIYRRLTADVPLGIFLSGGIDSSAIAAFARHRIAPEQVQTFSIGFEEPSFDESAYAHFAARHLGTTHHHRTLSLETATSLLPEIATMLDEPLGDSSLLPTYLLCKESRKHVTVALGGDGADELFAGYDPFHALTAANLYATLMPQPVHTAIRLLIQRLPVSHVNMSTDFKLKRTLRGLSYSRPLWNPVWQAALDPKEIEELFAEPTSPEELFAEAITCWEQCKQTNLVDKTLEYFTKLYLQNNILTKIDRASMMNSLEVRSPFLDIDLVNFVRRIPSSYKYRNGTTKYILKKALEPVLPKKILHRAKKGFGVPVGTWFRNKTLTIDPNSAANGLSRPFIERQIASHVSGRSDNRAFLWNAWLLEQFLKRNRV